MHSGLRNVISLTTTRAETGKNVFDCAVLSKWVSDYRWEGGERKELGSAFHMPLPKKHLDSNTPYCAFFHKAMGKVIEKQ